MPRSHCGDAPTNLMANKKNCCDFQIAAVRHQIRAND